MIQTNSCREFLETLFLRRKRNNARYSQRALARHLKMSPGELSEILRGKRAVTPKTAARIAAALGFSEFETKYLVQLAERERSPRSEMTPELPTQKFSSERFALAGDWFCWALFALTETRGFTWNQKEISKRLGVSEPETRIAIEKLKRVGVLTENETGYTLDKGAILFEEGTPSEAVRDFHRHILSKAEQALELQTVSEREFQGITLALNPSLLPLLKKELSNFLDELGQRYGSGKNKTEVYHIELAAFRLTQRSQDV